MPIGENCRTAAASAPAPRITQPSLHPRHDHRGPDLEHPDGTPDPPTYPDRAYTALHPTPPDPPNGQALSAPALPTHASTHPPLSAHANTDSPTRPRLTRRR
ncbi:hypothetical protein GCM10022254_50570 [Actinomadura meridiana]|uniref:Uncharacterized protein n=1 Tax=Actinomadura meridiana TaxID=559626 RepID=A0ABP8CCR1_9ACTN